MLTCSHSAPLPWDDKDFVAQVLFFRKPTDSRPLVTNLSEILLWPLRLQLWRNFLAWR